MDVKAVATKYADYQIEMRRWFHQHPELSMEEKETSAKVKEELTKAGIEWRDCGSEGYGILATVKGAKPGKTIMLRGDMDALSVTEETGLPYASQNEGKMHACGHDAHISTLLVAAHIINDMKDELCGEVRFAFQPAEEVARGAIWMIEDGALDGVDGCFSMHVWGGIPTGKYSCEVGPRMAGGNMFSIDITGKSGHGTQPNNGVDAIYVAAATIENLQSITSRHLSPVDPAVVTVGTIEGGSRWNVIAGSVHMEGTWRCFSAETHEKMPGLIDQIAKDTAKTFGATAETGQVVLIPPVINNPHVTEIAQGAAKYVLGEDSKFDMDPVMGGEDFAYFMNKVPGAVLLLGNDHEGCNFANHHMNFVADEDMLLNGAMIYAKTAVDFCAGK